MLDSRRFSFCLSANFVLNLRIFCSHALDLKPESGTVCRLAQKFTSKSVHRRIIMHLSAVAVAFLCIIASLMAFHSGTTCGRGRYLHNLHAKDGEQIKSMQGGRRNRKSRLKTEGPEFTGTLDVKMDF